MSALAAALLAGSVAACGTEAPAAPPPTPSLPPVPDAGAARAELAARAALAQDKRFAALYTFSPPDRPAGSVVATVATDGTWRVDIPDGALGGTADVSIVGAADGVYQCGLPSSTAPVTPACVRVAERGGRVPHDYDPQVQRLFRQVLSVLTDRQAPLSVTAATPLAGAQGSCYSIDSISASLKAPVDVGIYCYAADGMLTAVRVGFGRLTLTSVAAPPPTVDLPAPIATGPAMGMDSPPPPPTPTPSATVQPSASTG